MRNNIAEYSEQDIAAKLSHCAIQIIRNGVRYMQYKVEKWKIMST